MIGHKIAISAFLELTQPVISLSWQQILLGDNLSSKKKDKAPD